MNSIFSPLNNGHKKVRSNTAYPADEDMEVEDELDDDDDALDEEIESPPIPGGGGSIFSTIGSAPSLVESDASVKELFSNSNLLMKTDLPAPAIPLIARLFTLAYKYDAKEMQRFLWSYLKLRVSKDRRGRDDIVALAMRRQGYRDDEEF